LVEVHPISGVDIFIHSGSFPIANPSYANVPWIKRGAALMTPTRLLAFMGMQWL
jgi:hypothetical protein